MAKRGERVAPPPRRGEWELRFGESEAAAGWEELCRQAPGPLREAWDVLSGDPRDRTNPDRRHRLRSDPGIRTIKGKVLEQWQYEVTGAGRIWYCPDDALHVVFITKESTGHPGETD
jgi:hypothetical protein